MYDFFRCSFDDDCKIATESVSAKNMTNSSEIVKNIIENNQIYTCDIWLNNNNKILIRNIFEFLNLMKIIVYYFSYIFLSVPCVCCYA